MNYYPIFVDLRGKKVLLFGAGSVGLRKAKSLVEAGARLKVISPVFPKPFVTFARKNGVTLSKSETIPKNFSGVFLMVSATSNTEFNRSVYQTCLKKGILVNVVDDPKHCTFIVPSVVKRGKLQIAISTGGSSPLLAKKIRKKLEKQFGSNVSKFVNELADQRTAVKKMFTNQRERKKQFDAILRKGLKKLGF